jgi:hypothetical protein
VMDFTGAAGLPPLPMRGLRRSPLDFPAIVMFFLLWQPEKLGRYNVG